MAISLAQLLAGIRQVESGGNYTEVNSIGAVGAYQVMKANIPSWTLKALGHSMTWQQFRDSRSAQDKVAQVILGGFYKKYGPEGAAAMWLSGQPDPGSGASDGDITVREYVNKVMAASGGSAAVPAVTGDAGGGAVAPTPVLSQDELAAQYGLSASLINSNSELKRLFKQAVANTWSADLFAAKLKNTKWWGLQSDTLRQYITLKYTDPATFRQHWTAGQAAVNALAVQVGLGSQVNARGQSSQLLKDAVYNSVALGWTDARVKDWLGAKTTAHSGVMWGEAGEAFDKLHSLAYLNGMKYSAWYTTEARAIASGRSTQEAAEAAIRKQAAAKYSAFAPQILAGQNVMDLAAPYTKAVSDILEVPETAVDLTNSHVAKAMSYNKGGQAYSIWQFEQDLRKDPLWKKTQNAQDSATQTAHQVLQNFGMVF